MPYTEFRKSYNNIEVVIPAVDFSSLTRDEAVSTAKRLRAYVAGFVCHHLTSAPADGKHRAKKLVQAMLLDNGGNQCGEPHLGVLIRNVNSLGGSYFRVDNGDGILVRKDWCHHMAAEIEREFSLGETLI